MFVSTAEAICAEALPPRPGGSHSAMASPSPPQQFGLQCPAQASEPSVRRKMQALSLLYSAMLQSLPIKMRLTLSEPSDNLACSYPSRLAQGSGIGGFLMLWTAVVVVLVLWLLGFSFQVGGGLIHALLVIALIGVIYNLFVGRSGTRS